MSIISKFQSDMDQIISNFVPYTNPYIIISWKLPEGTGGFGLSTTQELRSQVEWSGSLGMTYPTELNASQRYQVTADTSFTIKGWLFPAKDDPIGNIYYINSNFYATHSTLYADLTSNTFTYPMSSGLITDIETQSLSANPQITDASFNV